MTRLEALRELAEKVEAGTVEWDSWLWTRCDAASLSDSHFHDAWRGELTNAMELHQMALPRHYAQIHIWPMPEMSRVDIGGGHTGRDDDPARAWLKAILAALIAKEDR